MADMTDAIAPKSDQMNADDLLAGPRTFTITRVVVRDGGEQPVSVWLEEFPQGRPWKPSKGQRRALVVLYGKDSDAYVGKRVTLWRNPAVTYAGQEVGGIQITHASGIDEPKTFALSVAQTKREPYTVRPLLDEPTAPPMLNTRSRLARDMYAAIEQAGVEKAEVVPWLCNVIGREITASKDMTEDEARTVLNHLEEKR